MGRFHEEAVEGGTEVTGCELGEWGLARKKNVARGGSRVNFW